MRRIRRGPRTAFMHEVILYEDDDSAYILCIVWRSGAVPTRGSGSDGLLLSLPRSLLLDIAINY